MKSVLLILTVLGLSNAFAANPVITHLYTADPSARVFNDVLYLYPSHDRDQAEWWDMTDWHVFSTTNMVDYTDHGPALSLNDISWSKKYAWAPDCIERNGTYYFYFPTDQKHIGVAVGDRPEGPFKDALGKPLLSKGDPGVVCDRDFIDPCPFIDDDGKAYLFAGQHTVNVIELNEDMISYSGDVKIIEGADGFFEAAWVHKCNGKYYLSYSGNGKILYATSDNVLGPYTFQGEILGKVNSRTNHHSIVKYKGKWYLFYHNADLALKNIPKGSKERKYIRWRRSVCVEELFYNPDGTIQKVTQTKTGVENPVTAEAWRPLFNGKDFNDWNLLIRCGDPDVLNKAFSITDDGTLHFFRDLPDGYANKKNRNSAHGVMATKASFKRYAIRFEYKWGKKLVNNFDQYQYDAGFFYHIQKLKVFPDCMQYQIRYNHLTEQNHSGDLLGQFSYDWTTADGKTFALPTEGGNITRVKRGMHLATKDAAAHGVNNQWNQCEIIVMGNEYAIHKLNGNIVNIATNLQVGEGPIGLEAETGEIFWRNIMIREFDQSIPIEQFLK